LTLLFCGLQGNLYESSFHFSVIPYISALLHMLTANRTQISINWHDSSLYLLFVG